MSPFDTEPLKPSTTSSGLSDEESSDEDPEEGRDNNGEEQGEEMFTADQMQRFEEGFDVL